MAPRKENMRRGPRAGSDIACIGHRCKVCIQCGKEITPNKEEDDAKETNRFINEEAKFSCGTHRRDEVCNDCFHAAVANDNERQAFRRSMDRAVKGIWKKIYLKEGDKVPWSEDEDEDNELPSENVQQQTEKASSSSLSQEKTCAHCGKVGNFDRCAKCKVTYYYSRSHQAADYAKHKADCQAPKTRVNDTAQTTKMATREEDVRGGPSVGSNYAPNKDEQPPAATWLICAECGIKSDELRRCSKCKCTWYCSQDHHKAHFPEHKYNCRLITDVQETTAQPPAMPTSMCHPHIWANRTVCLMNLKSKETTPIESPVISWKELENILPNVAIGRTLEVRIMSEPSGVFMEKVCDGRDAERVERKVALRKGCILRWRNPWL